LLRRRKTGPHSGTYRQRRQAATLHKTTRTRLKTKFDICAAQAVDRAAADKIYATLSTLGTQPSLDDFWPLLRKV